MIITKEEVFDSESGELVSVTMSDDNLDGDAWISSDTLTPAEP